MRSTAVQIALVAGEPSGDVLGASLIQQLKRALPQAEFIGVGGERMAAQGCRLLYRMERIGVMGVDGLLFKLFDILKIRRQLFKRFSQRHPAIFIGIDAPDFNLNLEGKLKRCGVKCVHYVSPTVWAWRGYRIHKIKRAVHLMLTLFPFEARYYRAHQVPVTCVGHPIADAIEPGDASAARRALNIDADRVIALLPGSRRSEVSRLSRVLLEAARLLQQRYPSINFVVPLANARVAEEFHACLDAATSLPLTLLDGQAQQAMQAADIVVLASGTAALEAALLGRPHVVVYKISKLSEWLLTPLKQVDHYSMTNHLLPTPQIPELMQADATADNIATEVIRILGDADYVARLQRQFDGIRRQLQRNASERACQAILELMAAHPRPGATQ